MSEKKLDLLRVLLVEDNEDDAALILWELKRANGFEVLMEVVVTANEMRAALIAKEFDIVLCDYYLPSFGIEKVVELLDEFKLRTPLILVSGLLNEEILAKLTKDGFSKLREFVFVNKNRLYLLSPVIKRELLIVSTYDKVLSVLARVLEYKDSETREHSDRVIEKSVQLGRALGLSQPAISHLRRGALLHDVGKMGVPDSVLSKHGKLTEEEWVQMRRHPQLAYDLLKDIPFLEHALDVPYCHHEHWDGSGYPRGLRGEDIPLAARIFSVIDNYDALTTRRPYREAMSKEFTLTYISEQSGKLFDPQVVEMFLKLPENQPDSNLQEKKD